MRMNGLIAISMLGLLLNIGWAQDQDAADDGDSTITVIENSDAQLSDAVTDGLPDSAAGEAVVRSEFGLSTAAAARERGREFGEDMAASARENRESFTRGTVPDLQELVPDVVPELPEIPAPPAPPGP